VPADSDAEVNPPEDVARRVVGDQLRGRQVPRLFASFGWLAAAPSQASPPASRLVSYDFFSSLPPARARVAPCHRNCRGVFE
jgi:hypothetical protein